MTAIAAAAASISHTPPRRLASATASTMQAVLTSAIVTTNDCGAPMCAAGASSQKSIGPSENVGWPVSSVVNEFGPVSGMCMLKTSKARVATLPRSATGCQPSCSAWTQRRSPARRRRGRSGRWPASPARSRGCARAGACARRPRAAAERVGRSRELSRGRVTRKIETGRAGGRFHARNATRETGVLQQCDPVTAARRAPALQHPGRYAHDALRAVPIRSFPPPAPG